MSQKIPTQDVTPEPAVQPATPGTVQQEMYAKRQHIYVREIKGLFQRVRRVANWALMLAFFALPWLTWGDRPMIWFDLPGREFHIFAATFYPQEFILLSWLLIICAFGLFFITVFAGRVWCGYTCPQSVWTYLYIWVEHRLEGSRNRRIKLDREPMSFDKAWRKSAKHAVWLAIALATGVTFVGYFTPIRELVIELPTLRATAGLFLGRVLRCLHLSQRRLATRAGVHLHVPLCPLPVGDVRRRHLDRLLRRGPR